MMTLLGQLRQTHRLALLAMVIALGGCLSAEPARTPSSSDLQQLRTEVAALQQRQQSDREQRETAVKRLERLELERETASRETQELPSRVGALATELAGLARETEGLAARVDQAVAANADRTDAVSGELQGIRERLAAMAAQLQELTMRLAAPPAVEQPPPSVAVQTAPSIPAQPPPPVAEPPVAEPPVAPPLVAPPLVAPPPVAVAPTPPTAAPAESALASRTQPVPAPAPTQSGEPRPDSGAAAISDPQSLYNAGYTDFGRGNYPLAIGAFREFIRRHPHDDLADNAQYWIAEAYLGLAHRYVNAAESERAAAAFAQAIEAFEDVWRRYPQGDKVPAAMFREASIHFELGQTDRARARLEYLVERFPSAPEARQARQRLADGASQ